MAGEPAEDELAQPAVAIAAHDKDVGASSAGCVQDRVGK